MLLDDFYTTTPAEEVAEPEKIKVGETEYTQDELNRLVGLGRIAQEAEEKYDRPISKFWPEYTKERQTREKMELELAELKARPQTPTTPTDPNAELTPDQLKAQARAQARELGLVSTEDLDSYIESKLQGRELLGKVESLVTTNSASGKPKVSSEELLQYMSAEGVRNPETAYELMFRDELKDWEKKQVDSIKQPGMVTERASTAGSKIPQPISLNSANLGPSLKAFLEAQDNQ